MADTVSKDKTVSALKTATIDWCKNPVAAQVRVRVRVQCAWSAWVCVGV